ncbi:MAG: F0F1 ATP synthase subunit B [Clostridia bacterium]|nr:F0F1 ATP synthase subunit B [Clostridia bacterium]
MLANVQTMDVVYVNIWAVVISLVNLLILFLILRFFLYRPVRRMLQQRQSQVDRVYSDAEQAKAESESMRQEYADKLQSAHDEATAIVSTARERAERLEDEIVKDAKEKAEGMVRQADKEISQERKKAMNEIKDDISAISVEIAEKVIGREINQEDHDKMIDSFIDDIGQ